jgi:hypothetical protein
MDARVKGLWLEALRSGEFTQGRQWLKTVSDDGQAKHCCLGVLCELAKREGVVTEVPAPSQPVGLEWDPAVGAGARGFSRADDGAASRTILPYAVAQWAGLEEPNPAVEASFTHPETGLVQTDPQLLALLNDVARFDFDGIAEAIERSL